MRYNPSEFIILRECTLNTIRAKGSAAISNWLKNASEMPEGRVVSSCELKESLLKDFLQFIILVLCILGLAASIFFGLWHEATRLPVIVTVGMMLAILAFRFWKSDQGVEDALSVLYSTKKIGGWHFNKFTIIGGTISLILSAIVWMLPVETRSYLLKTDIIGGTVGASISFAILFLGYLGIMLSLIVLYWMYKRTVGKSMVVTVELLDHTQVKVNVPWYKYAAAKLHFCTFYDLSH